MSQANAHHAAPDSPEPPEEGQGAITRQQSVGELVKEHDRVLHAFLMSRLRDEHEAREVAQEAYVRMLNLAEPGAISFMRAYLFRTAMNIAIDRAKHRKVRARYDQMEVCEEPIDELSPDRLVLSDEDVSVLKTALLELPAKCRKAFLLYRMEEWSAEKIANHMGLKERMVRRYLAQASVYCGLRVKGLSADAARAATHA